MAVHANTEAPDEGALHFFAREGQTILLWSVYILLGVTVLTMILFFPFAIIPATLLILAYVMLLVINFVERRSDRHAQEPPPPASSPATVVAPTTLRAASDRDEESVPEHERPWQMPLLRRETLIVSIGIFAVLLLAVLLAGLKFGGAALLVAVLFLFAYIVLLTSPVWMAALEDEIEDRTHQPAAEETE